MFLSVFCFVVLWGKFIAGLSGEASWRGLLGEYSTTTTVSCGETGDDGMDGVVSEVTTGELIEEEEAEVDKAVDVSCESLVLLPPKEGANEYE